MPLSDVEREITKRVVDRFLNLKETTPRKPLIVKFRAPETLDRLVKCGILKALSSNNEDFLPMALAFHYCGDSDAYRLARKSLEVVLHLLQNLFEVELDKTEFTIVDIEAHARKMYDTVEPETIWLGLYLAQEFGVLAGWSGSTNQTDVKSVRINERIVTLKNIETAWDEHVKRNSEYLDHDDSALANGAKRPTARANGANSEDRWFSRENRVRLYYLVIDCLTQPRPGDIGARGDSEFATLDAVLRRRFGRLSLGPGKDPAQIIQDFVLRAPKGEILTLIESIPHALTNALRGRIDQEWEDEVIEDSDAYVERAIQRLNQFLQGISCPARFLPNGKFDKEGFEDARPSELLRLPNREILKSDLEAALSSSGLVSLVFIDLDGFKQVNEQFGHPAGDECLQRAVQVMSDVTRSKGRLYRYGGDEFAVVLRNFEKEEAAATAERLRKAIENSNIGASVPVTASLGVAFAAIASELNSPESLIHAADEAAIVSKHTGKNRVTLWPPTDEASASAEVSRKQSRDMNGGSDESKAAFLKIERQMPELLAEMRSDLTQHPLRREFVILKKNPSTYWAQGKELAYFYDAHPDLDNKLRILQNLGLIEEITYNNVLRYVITEELADYLAKNP